MTMLETHFEKTAVYSRGRKCGSQDTAGERLYEGVDAGVGIGFGACRDKVADAGRGEGAAAGNCAGACIDEVAGAGKGEGSTASNCAGACVSTGGLAGPASPAQYRRLTHRHCAG